MGYCSAECSRLLLCAKIHPTILTDTEGVDPFDCHLGPGARGRAAVQDDGARPQEAVLVVHLEQLEGAPASVALLMSTPYVRVVHLADDPRLGRRTAALEVSGAALAVQDGGGLREKATTDEPEKRSPGNGRNGQIHYQLNVTK